MSIPCLDCGRHNAPVSRFCGGCGRTLAVTSGAPVLRVAAALPSTQIMSAPPATLVVSRPGQPDLAFPLTKDSASIGRADTCDIVIDAPGVSRLHAIIVEQGGAYTLRDQGSTNGIYVAGQRVTEAPLGVGELVRIPDPYGNVVTLTVCPAGGAGQNPTNGATQSALMAAVPAGQVGPPAGARAIQVDPGRAALTVGRDPGNDVVLDLPLVSRWHARIERQGDAFLVRDLGSTNGAWVNGRRVRGAQPLTAGDELRIGPALLAFGGASLVQPVQPARPSSVRIDAVDLVRHIGRDERNVILDNVSLSVLPQEFVAIVGGSGAGKSTLLHALCGATPAQAGRVLFNGQDFYRDPGPYSAMVGYVPQDDILHRELPVGRALDYAARLRLPPDTTPEERERRIDAVLADVKMGPQRHQPINKLSGGQRKRISIAVELLAQPSVLFLDEPTSGLDPGLDKTMMSLLQLLCDKGQTIVLVTHATENIHLCGLVAFVAGRGRLVYYGPPADAPAFFGVPAFSDIYSFFDQSPDTVEQQQGLFHQSAHYQANVLDRRSSLPASAPTAVTATPAAPLSKRQARAAATRQWRILTQRYAELLWRDRVNLGLLLAQAPVVALLLTLVTPTDTYTPPQFGSTQQVLFMLTLAAIWFGTINAAREIVKERAVYLRERMINLRVWPYVLSKFAVLAALSTVQVLLLLWIVSLKTAHLPAQGILLPAPLEMYVTLTLTALAGAAGGLLLSSLVSSSDRAMSIVPVVLIAQVIFSGSVFDLLGGAKIFSYLAISHWCLAALGSTVDLNGLEAQLPAPVDGWPKEMFSTPDPAHLLGYWLVLAAFTVVLLMGAYASLRRGDARAA